MKRYELRTSTDGTPVTVELSDLGFEHIEALEALRPGEEYEIPQVGAPHLFITCVWSDDRDTMPSLPVSSVDLARDWERRLRGSP